MGSAQLQFHEVEGRRYRNLHIETYIDLGNHHYGRKEILFVGARTDEAGTHSMYIPQDNSYNGIYFTFEDYDLVEDSFEIDSSYGRNEIYFSVLDTANGYASGYFDCRFIIISSAPSGNNPDTILFSECHFEAWLN